jgi:hypothetical protein
MSTWQHTGMADTSQGGIAIKFGDSGSIDAFARQRISEPFTLFDSKQIFDDPDIANNAENYPLFWDNQETRGGGTATSFNVNRASTILSVSATTAGTRVRQTKQRFNYQPGKSLLVILTGLAGNTSSGNTKRYGYFDDDNGVFYQDDGGSWAVVIRSFVSGVAIDTVVNQEDWNLDTMDGNGASGVTLDPAKVQILFFDLEWLGVGRARFGFFIDGLPIYCHEALHSNRIGSVYMSNPNLPIRLEISNDGSGGADTVEGICTTVVSEGGVQPNGVLRFGDIGDTTAEDISAPTAGTIYAICGIRLKAAYLAADVREVFVSIIENSGANNPFVWRLHLNPTITAALTYSNITNSAIQFGIGDTATPANNVISASGTIIAGGYQARTDANANVSLQSALRLGSLIDGTADQLVLSGAPITTNNLFFGGMQWREAW